MRSETKESVVSWSFIGNVVIHATGETWNEEADRMEGSHRALGEFYAELLEVGVIRDDWVKVGHDMRTYPQIAFDGVKHGIVGSPLSSDYRPPRWPDPAAPQQIHMDIAVANIEAAAESAIKRGATLLRDNGEHRVFADAVGHPFCLIRSEKVDEPFEEISLDFSTGTLTARPVEAGRPRIARIILDCDHPHALADFYEQLLAMPRVHEDTDRVVIARSDSLGVQLGFQRVPAYLPPRWGEDAYHQQVHLDLWFEDAREARARAERLGAKKTPHPRENVYADPAGHPMCLLAIGQ
jgi:hypothetical protein